MAIDRGPWNALVDDDGSNLVGSLWNKAAIKTVLLDPIDGALAAAALAWTPTDASGAGLAFGTPAGRYAKIGVVTLFWGDVTYPATANGAAATIGGLPGANAGLASAAFQVYGAHHLYHIQAANTTLLVMNPVNNASRTNAEMSGARVMFAGFYQGS